VKAYTRDREDLSGMGRLYMISHLANLDISVKEKAALAGQPLY